MRTYLLVLILISSFLTHLQSQNRASKTYALVIGVSKYEDPKITALKYAHQDAVAFSDLCLSPSGLNIPSDQIRVLTDEKASYWNIVDGLDWLKSKALKDDQIYIYFAGHGDMESKELKYGYLLAHDSRYMNYLGRSLSLDLLNKTAHTLTVDKKAKVFLITDACHSGKLAGVDFNGSNLVALNLMQLVSNNEVRITSCNEGELSYESETWGDGRGAFSYFLTRGMSGEADGVNGKKDGTITIGEIKSFLSGKVPNEVRTIKSKKQNPVIMGTETVILNQFKPSSNIQSLALAASSAGSTTEEGSRSVSALVENTLEADILNAVNSKLQIDFGILSTKTKKEIINELLDNLRIKGNHTKKTLVSTQTSHLVAKILYDKVQHVIDLYLSGDEAELEKRRYYNQVDKPYDQYPYMLDIAIKLLEKDHYLIPSLLMQRSYLAGLNYRLKTPFKDNYKAYLDTALIYQNKALSIDSSAAYIHNELGILNNMSGKVEQAIMHFERAISISPLWSLPYSNIANAYYKKGDLVTSKEYVDVAMQKQNTLQSPYIINGNLFCSADNYLFAEEQYQKAIQINSRHFLPFDKLGDLHLKVQDYQTSEHYYLEAAIRKIGLNQQVDGILVDSDGDGVIDMLDREMLTPVDTTKWGNDIMTCFAFGKLYFDKKDFINAKKWFDKVVSLDVENPLVYHYLGQISYSSQDYAKAEYYFILTKEFHLVDSLFDDHVTKITSGFLLDIDAYSYYMKSKFDIYDPTIYLARTYEKWGYFSLAAERYNECIKLNPKNKIAYQMLWNMYKDSMELESAESVIYRFGQVYPNDLDDVLTDFYDWATTTFKEDLQKTEYYAYKYGLLMHAFVKKNPDKYFASFVRAVPVSEFDTNIQSIVEGQEIVPFILDSEIRHQIIDVSWKDHKGIGNPLITGIEMFKKVESISIDNNIKADALAKMGDLYLYSNEHMNALESYESSLSLKDDHHTLRSMSTKCADFLYLFQKSFEHLTTLQQSNRLKYEDAVMLAQYYMKYGDKEKAIKLSEEITITHPFLKEEIEEDVIKMHLRFGEYPKAIELINRYIDSDTTDMNLEYMLARSYAGLNQPEESLKHLQNAESSGFDYGFVYKNDGIFDPYRSFNQEWKAIQEKMDGFIKSKVGEH
jgi:tetratricopeptide (TPR) repeat protein